MCFSCCTTRQTINTYLLVITISIFLYSLITYFQHASTTLLFNLLENKLNSQKIYSNDEYITNRRISSTNDDEYDIYISQNYKNYVNSLRDINSYIHISSLTYNDLEDKSYNVLNSLRKIEKGFGITFIIMHIIFLFFIFLFLCFSCGNKEYTLSSETSFNALSRLKSFFLILSILLIMVSLVYSTLLSCALVEYTQFIPNPNIDTFIQRIIIGMVYGIYGFFYYIIVFCGFTVEKNLFVQLGYQGNPGKLARYNNDGTPIIRNIPPEPSSQNIVIQEQNLGMETPQSKEPINVEELVKIEPSERSKKKHGTALNHNDINQQVIILSSSIDEKYLYYNGETYMKMDTTNSNNSSID